MKISNIRKVIRMKINRYVIMRYIMIFILISSFLVPVIEAENFIANFNILTKSSIAVSSPNGGENWASGTFRTIKWSSTGNRRSNVRIELFKSGVLSRTISVSTDNDGYKSWTVPSGQALGDDYKIKITNLSNVADYDFSDSSFKISGPSITLVAPNGGENIARDTTYRIKWDVMGDTGSHVKIELFRGSTLSRTITSKTSNGGSFKWKVPSSQALDSNYKIKITSTTNSTYFDVSDNYFTIGRPSIRVTSPNGGENIARGTTYTIKWDVMGDTGSRVKIELFRGGTLSRTISSSTSNNGLFSWKVLSSQVLDSNYKIKITSRSNSKYFDESDDNFTISGTIVPFIIVDQLFQNLI